jgi:ligand-binding SRPBCC domain-containing protein
LARLFDQHGRSRVVVTTQVPAPVEIVYAALLDPEMHARTAPGRERVVDISPRPSEGEGAGVRGRLGLGDEVTFEATHFGFRQRLTARITATDPPHSFEDRQVRGFFRHLVHLHEFMPEGEGTRMVDAMEFASPLGTLFDRYVLAPYLQRFLTKRGEALALLLQNAAR